MENPQTFRGTRRLRRVWDDDEVVEAIMAAGATLYFTGTRHFFH